MIIFHLIELGQNINLSKIYREIFKDVQIKYNIKLYICYKSKHWKITKNKTQTSISYNKDDQLIGYIQDNYKIEDVIITTFSESLVEFCHYLKKTLGQNYTKYYDIFLDKNKQRLSTKEHPEIGVQSYTIGLENNLKIEDINHLSYPLIIKPVAGVGSRGVQKITNFEELKNAILIIKDTLIILGEKNLHNKRIIVEEYIDGEQYVFNYFVNNDNNYILSLPTKVLTLQDIHINDFGNWIRLITPDIYDHIDNIKLHNNISKTIIGGKIANTYVSHNIKITPQGEYKTVEINGRIGGYRLEMNWLAAKYNLFDAIINSNKIDKIEYIDIKKSVAIISIRPIGRGKLESFNKDIIKKIQGLQSFGRLSLHKKFIGQIVGLSHQGYSPLGTIVLLNDNHNIFNQDLTTIKELYIHIINISKKISS